ncbi:MAG: hypothetical protein CBC57_06705 [Euryarchaeota archaeon TMED97]|nr:MAG: hypothetical protein CBC57_06705 [Euryarchaeota archaeon TMED97]
MTQVSNTYDSYDMKGIREDLSDIIYNITPDDTPFLSACKKAKATSTYYEWQTDTLRSAVDTNYHIDGDETAFEDPTASVRLGNYTQIFKNAVIVSDTASAVTAAGRKEEMAYQMLKVAREQKLDIEKTLFSNHERIVGTSSVPRQMAGLGAIIKTNTNKQNGNGGSDPTTILTDPRNDDGTPTAFDGDGSAAQASIKFDDVMEKIWTSGGNPDRCYLSPFQMNQALNFVGNNNQRSQVQAGDQKVIKSLDVYVTPWGTVEFVPSREIRGRDVYILQNDMWAIHELRPTTSTELAKTGDATKRQVLTELTLCAKNEASSGGIFDNTTT